MAAVPMPEGVKTPVGVIVPLVADQVTAVLKLPVPMTFDVHVDVCVVEIELGRQLTVTDVIAEVTLAVTVAEPNFVPS